MSFYKQNADITHILDNMDVYVLPVMNPDGYKYTWTTVRTHETSLFGCLDTAVVLFPDVSVSEQDVEEEPLPQQEERLRRSRPQQKLRRRLVQ